MAREKLVAYWQDLINEVYPWDGAEAVEAASGLTDDEIRDQIMELENLR